jgi:hypothetical protein
VRGLQRQHVTYVEFLQLALETVIFAVKRVGHHRGELHFIRERPLHQLVGYLQLGAELRIGLASLKMVRRKCRARRQ